MPTFTTNYNLIKPNVNDPVDEDLWGGYLNDDLDDIDALIKTATDTASAAGVPIGSVVDYCGTAAPSGYLLCYGQAVSRTVTYDDLFAAIGTTYGTGDGATTFNVPDFRGRVGAGQDDMGGTSANRLTGLTDGVDGDTLGAAGGAEGMGSPPNHTHFVAANVNNTTDNGNPSASTYIARQYGQNVNADYRFDATATAATVGLTSTTGGGAEVNIVQPTLIVNKIIRYA